MLRHLPPSLRALQQQRGYAVLNVVGLAAGLAVALLVGLFVRHELSYDRFHPGAERLYRVVQDVSWAGGMTWDWTTPVLAPLLAEELPEIEAAARFHPSSALVSREGTEPLRVQEEAFAFVDPSFLDLFAFSLLEGDPAHALAQPGAVVLTEGTARRYFGRGPALGRALRLDNALDLTVTGVVQDPSSNTHLDFDFLASLATLDARYGGDWRESWWWPNLQTYVRLADGASPPPAEALAAFVARHREPHFAEAIIPRLQPVTRIHLYDNPGTGAIRYVRVFALIGVFVLLLACVNYVNLATARAARRAREVGVRKALGAGRGQLVWQFLGESVLLTALALALALLLAAIALPGFNELTGAGVTIDPGEPVLWGALAALVLGVGVLSGSYPAFVLSRFSPQHVLKGKAIAGGGLGLRRGLVVLQLAVTIALVAGSLVIYRQVDFLRSAPLGFEAEEVVALRLRRDGHDRFDALKGRLQEQPGVLSVAGSSWFPGAGSGGVYATTIGSRDIENDPQVLHVDADFFRTLGIEAAGGRLLSGERPADLQGAFLLNETAVRQYELEAPLGERLRLFAAEGGNVVYEREGEVVGIVPDFHLTHLRTPIQPAAITLAETPELLSHVLVRLAPGTERGALAGIGGVWATLYPELPLELSFVDEKVGAQYAQEARFGRAIGVLSVLAVLIACLGLFGLAAFAAERRTKEIGIRKVLGASAGSLVALLSREYLALLAAAFVVAAPVAYWATGRWLEAFPYRVSLGPDVFFLAGALALLVALATVSTQALRAASADPVRTLRSE